MTAEGGESPGAGTAATQEGAVEEEALDAELLKILACPKCKAAVEQEGDRLVCVKCGLRYRIEEGIPIMLIDEAEPSSAEREAKPE
jgi:uncharacterized protein YbaR (Trm112 family)